MPRDPGAAALVAAAPVGYAGLLRRREYLALLVSRAVSVIGDQLARVALTVLVFTRTESPLLSALTYAATFLPVVLGGPLLGGLADRLPRRRLLVGADLLRAALFALMAVPGVPLPALLALVLLASAVEAPWAAARTPLLREILVDDDDYQRGSGLDEGLEQTGQVVGFVGAGALLLFLAPTTALLLDAVTFCFSAVVVRLLLEDRAAADTSAGPALGGWADARLGLRTAFAPDCRLPLLLTWVVLSLSVAPEALAAPWAQELGGDTRAVGLLFAANPAGTVLGLALVARLPFTLGQRLLLPLGVLTLVPLLATGFLHSLPLVLTLVVLSGVASSFSLLARVAFVRNVDPRHRGRAFAVAAAGITAGQGLGIALAGALAVALGPGGAVAVCAGLGLLLLVTLRIVDLRGINRP